MASAGHRARAPSWPLGAFGHWLVSPPGHPPPSAAADAALGAGLRAEGALLASLATTSAAAQGMEIHSPRDGALMVLWWLGNGLSAVNSPAPPSPGMPPVRARYPHRVRRPRTRVQIVRSKWSTPGEGSDSYGRSASGPHPLGWLPPQRVARAHL